MRYWYDTEFLEDGETIKLISIGIVAEDGREYYAVNADMPTDRIKQHRWLMDNVWPHLPLRGYETKLMGSGENVRQGMTEAGHLDTSDVQVKPLWVIANEVREFLAEGLTAEERQRADHVDLVAFFGAYDHVRLMQLWGSMMMRPKFLPMYTFDLVQEANRLGVHEGDYPPQVGDLHNALADARWNQELHKALESTEEYGR